MFWRLIKTSRKLYVPLGWTIFTQILLSLPGSLFEGSGLFHVPHLDKIAHLGLFGGLAFFWILFFFHRNNTLTKNTAWGILFLIALYGIGVEFFQYNFIPRRSFDMGDIVADICGALCGYFATIWILRIRANR
ncbi:MAG TPA: VanZ family protein [Chitinophagaceae bacterium]|nr:VanZ family protein [Chitinophagaceae bacterium]